VLVVFLAIYRITNLFYHFFSCKINYSSSHLQVFSKKKLAFCLVKIHERIFFILILKNSIKKYNFVPIKINVMPRKDIYHDTVKIALEKDGWVIIKENLNLSVDDTPLYADLGAEAVFVAERKGEKAAFEIKTFGGQSFVTNLHEAVGQYGVY
jgi:hypothetical protein